MGKAEELANRIRTEMAEGRYPSGRLLPSVRDLALKYRINPNTIVRAFQILIEEGLVIAEQRRGFFAARDNIDRARAGLRAAAARALEDAVEEANITMSPKEIRAHVEKALKESMRSSA